MLLQPRGRQMGGRGGGSFFAGGAAAASLLGRRYLERRRPAWVLLQQALQHGSDELAHCELVVTMLHGGIDRYKEGVHFSFSVISIYSPAAKKAGGRQRR